MTTLNRVRMITYYIGQGGISWRAAPPNLPFLISDDGRAAGQLVVLRRRAIAEVGQRRGRPARLALPPGPGLIPVCGARPRQYAVDQAARLRREIGEHGAQEDQRARLDRDDQL